MTGATPGVVPGEGLRRAMLPLCTMTTVADEIMKPRTRLASVLVAMAVAACARGGTSTPSAAFLDQASPDSCARVRSISERQAYRVADRHPKRINYSLPSEPPTDAATGYVLRQFMLSFVVDTAGLVDPASVHGAPGIGGRFMTDVRRMARGWRYEPALWNGCRVNFAKTDTFTATPMFGPGGL